MAAMTITGRHVIKNFLTLEQNQGRDCNALINSMKHTTKTKILAALKSGNARSLSALTKLTKSTKVATRISDLRAKGYDIRNTCKHLKSGEVRSTYQLITK